MRKFSRQFRLYATSPLLTIFEVVKGGHIFGILTAGSIFTGFTYTVIPSSLFFLYLSFFSCCCCCILKGRYTMNRNIRKLSQILLVRTRSVSLFTYWGDKKTFTYKFLPLSQILLLVFSFFFHNNSFSNRIALLKKTKETESKT